jgi:hypothetical protein
MKKIIFYALTLTFFVFGQTSAQSVAEQNLNSAIQSAENVQQEVATARKAVNQLVKQLTVLNNPNAALFEAKMNYHVNAVLNNSDDIQYLVGLAKSNSTIPFASTVITTAANELVNQNDIIMGLTANMTAAINAHNTSLAIALVQPIRSALTRQYNKSGTIITEIETIKNNIRRYTVCVKLVDSNGNQAIDGGFGAQNTVTGEVLYPGDPNAQDYGYGNCFLNLPAGTYNFYSYPSQGSLCGTGNLTVTLTPNLVNTNGIVEVTLVTWCE